jgi:hypothetical protein
MLLALYFICCHLDERIAARTLFLTQPEELD